MRGLEGSFSSFFCHTNYLNYLTKKSKICFIYFFFFNESKLASLQNSNNSNPHFWQMPPADRVEPTSVGGNKRIEMHDNERQRVTYQCVESHSPQK